MSKFYSKHSDDVIWDDVVIGSGMGGMTTAAMLSKLGRRVLVLEQHYVPGGFTHSFHRPGYEWDVGVHAVGEVTEKTMTGRLLQHLTDGRLQWASLGESYDEFYFPDDFRIDFPDTPHQFESNLVTAFPDEASAIAKYFERVREVVAGMRRYYFSRVLPQRTAWLSDQILARSAHAALTESTASVLNSLTSNERLKTVLTAQWGYYGSPPERSSFAMHALVAKHFMWGGYYPVGGAGQIAEGLLGTVASAGGWTRIRADVDEILIKNGAAWGVRLRDGTEIRARRVTSAADAIATAERLLPEPYRSAAWSKSVRALDAAPAHVCLYIGFKGDIRSAGAGSANKWFYEAWSSPKTYWDLGPEGPHERPKVLYTSFPSLKDPTHDAGPELRHTGEVVTFVPWSVFEPWQNERWMNRGPAYEALKAKIQDSLLEGLLAHMPGLRPYVDHLEVSTPVTTDHFCRPVQGSIYGIEPTPRRFKNPWLRPRSPVKNLFFSGASMTSVGVIGAMMGGVLAAAAMEPVGTFKMMRQVV